MPQTVQCAKLGRELPGLAKPPFPGELGQRVFENISEQAWQMWHEQSVVLINHYGLSLADPKAMETLMEEMEKFFFSEEASMPDEWVPEGEGTGAGIPGLGGGEPPGGKGAPEGAPGGKGAPEGAPGGKGAPARK